MLPRLTTSLAARRRVVMAAICAMPMLGHTADLSPPLGVWTGTLGTKAIVAWFSEHTDVVFWNANFVTLRFYTWAAGEGRRGISTRYGTWSALSGAPVNPWRWVGAGGNPPQLPAALRKHFFRGLREDPECREGYQGKDAWVLTFDAKGLHFEEEAWGNGCEKSFFLPFDKANSFLTPAGRQAAAALQLP
jgi:hypothetical protein